MNTRLQVEHLITEMVTGVDIVKAQIEIAAGQRFKLTQKDIVRKGHAMNCRINAEDPKRGFVPSPGKIESYHQPGGPGIRVDTHLYTGHSISVFYDPLIMKLAAWGNNRREVIQRMKNALNETAIVGVKTNIPFLRKIMEDKDFLKGAIHTRFIEERIKKLQLEPTVKDEEAAAIIAVITHHNRKRDFQAVIPKKENKAASLWKLAGRMKRARRTR
jgi:acetyl-CoA carboxylase biotin carboxylase subunit